MKDHRLQVKVLILTLLLVNHDPGQALGSFL